MKDGGILADLHPDELLSTGLLGENGIREPLYLTAMRYAGVDILPEKKPSHVESVIINESDRTKIHNWFHAQPAAEKEAEKTPLLEVKNLSFGYTKEHQTLRNVSLFYRERRDGQHRRKKRCRKIHIFQACVRL